MHMGFHLTSHSSTVNNNFNNNNHYLIMFVFYKTVLNKCCSYKNINLNNFDHTYIYVSHENVRTDTLTAEFEILLTEFPILVLQWFRRISSSFSRIKTEFIIQLMKLNYANFIYSIQKFVHMHYE